MADLIIKKGQSANLNEENVPIIDGQILITEDTGEMFVDMSDGTRKKIGGTSSGVGQETSNGGVIFNDYENNKAYGENATAAGTNTTAGSNAFKILSVDTENLTMTLSSVNGLTTGLECSCQYKNNYDFFGIIASINTDNNTVTFDKVPASEFIEGATNVLWVPSNPELGDGETIIGDEAYSAGYSNRANQAASAAFGKNNNAAGKYSFVANKDNVAGYSAAAFGMKTKAKGEYSFTAGYNTYAKKSAVALNSDTQAIHENAMAINQGTISTLWSQLVCGTYNSLDDKNAMFIVGNGNDDSNRSNAFIVNRDGSAVLNGSLTSNGIISNNNMQVTGSISCTGDISFNGSTLKNNGTTIIKAGTAPPTIILGVNNSNRPSDSLTWGNGAISAGSSKAYHENAVALGDNSTAYSFNSVAIGYSNNAGLASDLAVENKWHGSSVGAVAIGWGNNVINSYSVAVGTHLLTKHSTQTVIGCYNIEDENAAVIFGAGVNDTVRYNALTVKSNFNTNHLSSWVEVAEQGTTNNSVTTKEYVDNEINTTKEYVDNEINTTKEYVDNEINTTKKYVDDTVTAQIGVMIGGSY